MAASKRTSSWLRAHEGADDAHAGQGLAHDLVDAVQLGLHRPEERDGAAHDEEDDDEHEGQDHDQEAGQGHVLAEGHDHAADARDRRQDHDREGHEDDHLDLLDVVRVAGDQRSRPEVVDLHLGVAGDALEDRRAHVAPEGHGDPCAEVHGHDGADAQQQAHEEHEEAGPDDVVRVALGDAVVDDVGVEAGQVQVGDGLHEQQHQDDADLAHVRAQVLAQERDHRSSASNA